MDWYHYKIGSLSLVVPFPLQKVFDDEYYRLPAEAVKPEYEDKDGLGLEGNLCSSWFVIALIFIRIT